MDEERVEAYLEQLDLNPSDRGHYWLIRCPRHEDRQPSAQCYKDDGFINPPTIGLCFYYSNPFLG